MWPRPRADLITRWIRRARWWTARSSPVSDREFHDALFAAQRYDPFTPSYPGYLTIRRFAELAAARLGASGRVADVGCGPGEITCELARRLPGVRFSGFDHSASAVERAREHAARLELSNISFDVADAASLTLARDVEAVVMFDAFHHLTDPAAFVSRHDYVARWVLLEPAGDPLGRWTWDVEFDWLPLELDKVRQRYEAELSTVSAEPPPPGPDVPSPDDAAVERRYTIEDFERFFSGCGLSVQGTVAGLLAYPEGAYRQSPGRDAFGDFAYELLRRADDALHADNRDLGARHWCITAQRGSAERPRRRVRRSGPPTAPARVQGQYDVEYLDSTGPAVLAPGVEVRYRVRLANRGWQTWRSDGTPPFLVSYHWLDDRGQMLVRDGLRSPFPHAVAPGETVDVAVRVTAPEDAGRYVLQFDLIH
jgi:SAM-dependent methyltransferase